MGKQANPLGAVFYISEWGKRVGKRQKDVVAATGLNKGYVSSLWNRNDGKQPSPDVAAKIAHCFGVHAAALQVHPKSPEGRAFLAMGRIPQNRQDAAIEMLEGLAQRRSE